MNQQVINGLDLVSMISNGAKALGKDIERINSLNVFPVPDGDTGTNMKMTIDGGAAEGSRISDESIGNVSKSIARAMVLSARGNSGVILSQFFKGMSLAFEGKDSVSVLEFAKAMQSGTDKAYSVVSNPTEGTILTVMREAGVFTFDEVTADTTLEEYLIKYLINANESLKRTPELLPVLKKAGVIDSGGAGFILIVEGMLSSVRGEEVDFNDVKSYSTINTNTFNADSILTYGYCTEFILQLQNSKVDPKTFDLNIINSFLNTIGNSIVSFKDDDIIKVHVHTFDPGIVLTECRKYGEFLTIKIENMNVQHSENIEIENQSVEEEREHKKYAIVTVANGTGLVNMFKEMGVDEVVTGGQTMNTSTQDFITAFEKLDADNILVFPNNGNILMAAKQAAEAYTKANVYVVPSKTIAEGYSAIAMINFDSDDINEILDMENEVMSNVSTLEVTYSIRDALINDINIKKGDYICLLDGELIAASKSRLCAVKKAIKAIPNFKNKQVLTILCGQDVTIEECVKLQTFASGLNPYIEVYPIEGNQEIYSYIIGIE